MAELDLGQVVGPPGPQGAEGPQGPQGIQGIQGEAGPAGKSAYEYAAEGGYEGTEAAFQALMGTGPWVPKAGFVPASNRNLLDNGYLLDPINQRGIVSGAAVSGYFIDRWGALGRTGGSITWTSGEGVTINGLGDSYSQIAQNLENSRFPQDAPLTLSALYDGNQIKSITLPAGSTTSGTPNNQLRLAITKGYPSSELTTVFIQCVNGITATIQAAKLEVGTEQTLARQDASGGWVLNASPPNKALELIKCMRYQQVLNSSKVNYAHFGMGLAISETEIRIVHQMQIPLRTDPTLTAAGKFKVRPNMANPPIEVSSVLGAYQSPQSIVIRALAPVTAGNWYDLRPDPDDIGRIILDANL